MNIDGKLLKIPNVDLDYFNKLLKESLNGIRVYSVLMSSLELGVFDALKVPKGIDELSKELKCDKKLLLLLCKILCKLKLLSEVDGKFVNTKLSMELLTSDSFYSQKVFMECTRITVDLWMDLTNILKKGAIKRKPDKFFAEKVIHSLAQRSLLGEIQKTVEIVSGLQEFKKARRLLDLGGGHGLYAIAFAKLNPELEAYVFDLPPVVEKTKEYIEKFGCDRVKVIAGNFFSDDIGENYDIVFSSYNPGGKNPYLISKIYSSLNEGGIYINKQVFRDDKEISLLDLEWNLWNFEGIEKDIKIYTFKNDLSFKEYLNKLEEVGFKVQNVVHLDEEMGTKIIIAKKVCKGSIEQIFF